MRKSRKRMSRKRVSRKRMSRRRVSRKRASRTSRRKKQYRLQDENPFPWLDSSRRRTGKIPLWSHDYTQKLTPRLPLDVRIEIQKKLRELYPYRLQDENPLPWLSIPRRAISRLWGHDYTKPVSSREVFLRKIGNVVPPLPYDIRTEIKYKLRVLSLLKLIDNCLIVPEGDTPINSKEFLQELLNAKIIYSYEYYDRLEIKIDDQKTYFLKQKEGVLGSVFGNINDVYDIWGEILANYLDKFKKLEKLELDTRFPREWGLKNLKYIPPKLEYLSMPLLEVSPKFCRNIKVLEITYDFPLTDEYINSLKIYSNIEVLILEIDPDQEPYDTVHKIFPNNPVFYFFEILKTKFPNLKKLILTNDREIIYES